MNAPPIYFENIRKRSADRWEQLERDKELAAPWHQLFRQIQSPRHVVSELLQNADDAGATHATVTLGDGTFHFSHNGEDFQEQHFTSLCRFGYSNKRSLHTIGFRGIGFKSTFSLGDEVRIVTPSLRVAFRSKRFTEPVWLEDEPSDDGLTRFSVAIRDSHRQAELERNLTSWLESPTSLLFFRSVRGLRIGNDEVEWLPDGVGPVANSEWLSLAQHDNQRVLLIRSAVEPFPEDAKAEIRQERMVEDSEETDLPPCSVEIVLGLEGRLYVVLPTDVKVCLPFGCNAPFIQDPARLKIKDPGTSPTNRWLLERVGRLAAATMLDWLKRGDLPIVDRVRAYQLLVCTSQADDSLEGACESIVAEAFKEAIQDKEFLLTHAGDLFASGNCLAVPPWLTDVWSPEQISALFDESHRPILAAAVDAETRAGLARSGHLPQIGLSEVMQVLRNNHLPRPDSWSSLLMLWQAVAETIAAPRQPWQQSWNDVRIVPVQGHDCLYSGPEVVRLGEKRLLKSNDDWEFLGRHLLVMNPNWTRFIAEQRRVADSEQDSQLGTQVHNADRVLQAIGLSDSSDVGRVMERVSEAFFAEPNTSDDDCIRLAHIAAALQSSLPSSFQFITRDGKRQSRLKGGPILADTSSDIDLFVDERWCERHALHATYWSDFQSCMASEWREWIESGRSGLLCFVPLIQVSQHIYRRSELEQFVSERGHVGPVYYQYVTYDFIIDDWDFAAEHWKTWERLADSDSKFWPRLLCRILQQPPSYWQSALTAKAYQVATTGRRGQLCRESLTSAWLFKLRAKSCLQDTWGNVRQPAELLRRTPETESLLDTEPFVRAELDTEATRPLLVRLGVRDTPTGPDSLVERLKALATVSNPPFFEVQKWCHRLDSMATKCSTEQLESLKRVFHAEQLIFTTENTWTRASEVFLNGGDEVVGVPLVHDGLKGLTLWQRIEVEDRPTIDRVIAWLRNLPSNEKLLGDDLRRVRDILARYPTRVWDECGHWLNLEGEWVPAETLHYQISMQSLVAWRHLFPGVRQQVADLQRLPYDVVNLPPFCELASLGSVITERIQIDVTACSPPRTPGWLFSLGQGLARIAFDNAEKTDSVRELGHRMARTQWMTVTPLETTPYIDGTPAGTGRATDAVWDGNLLYVDDRPTAKLFRPVAQELARPFEDEEIADAIKACVERSPEFIIEYLSQNFTLEDVQEDEHRAETTDETSSSEQSLNSGVLAESNEQPSGVDNSGNFAVTEGDGLALPEAIQIEDEELGSEFDSEQKPPRQAPSRPSQPPLIERFARSLAFQKDGQGRFYHADGRWLERAHQHVFPWELFSPDGELLRCYWTKEHCLERGPLEVPAEVWNLCQKSPALYSFLTVATDGSPTELTGERLKEMMDEGSIALFPATYRLAQQAVEEVQQ